MKIENGIRLESIISSIIFYDCFVPEFWKYVNSFFGDKILLNDDFNKQIVSILTSLVWFDTVNGMIFTIEDLTEYHIQYVVENNVAKYLCISFDGVKLWELKR